MNFMKTLQFMIGLAIVGPQCVADSPIKEGEEATTYVQALSKMTSLEEKYKYREAYEFGVAFAQSHTSLSGEEGYDEYNAAAMLLNHLAATIVNKSDVTELPFAPDDEEECASVARYDLAIRFLKAAQKILAAQGVIEDGESNHTVLRNLRDYADKRSKLSS